ncbi:hypothetical protein AGMMS49983_11180 [Clostridia bacterium]|nr:hypothetical protein AGMMS49983_11180 [Clostridia bacterium]
MFETETVEKRIKDLVQKIGTDFLADEGVFRAVINDVLYDLKLERTVLINATSVHIGKIFLTAKDLPYEEKRKAKNKAKDKLVNEAAFSEEGADFVVTVLSSALGWQIQSPMQINESKDRAENTQKIRKRNSVIEKICPYCMTEIKVDEEVVLCSQCDMPHHRECWTENGGCTTFGCQSRKCKCFPVVR